MLVPAEFCKCIFILSVPIDAESEVPIAVAYIAKVVVEHAKSIMLLIHPVDISKVFTTDCKLCGFIVLRVKYIQHLKEYVHAINHHYVHVST